jgi:hypothetical protein
MGRRVEEHDGASGGYKGSFYVTGSVPDLAGVGIGLSASLGVVGDWWDVEQHDLQLSSSRSNDGFTQV